MRAGAEERGKVKMWISFGKISVSGAEMTGLGKGKLPLPAILASSARRFVRRFGFGKTKKFSVEGLKRIICRYLLRV